MIHPERMLPTLDNYGRVTAEEKRLKSLALPDFRLPHQNPNPAYSLPPIRSPLVPFATVGPVGMTAASETRSEEMTGDSSQPRKAKDRANQNWDAEEDAKIIQLRSLGMTWNDVASQLPGRTKIACRLHFQHCLEKKGDWDDHKKTRLAQVYEERKAEIWQPIATELGVHWRNIEAMHWVMGERGIARRVNKATSPRTAKPSSSSGAQSPVDSPTNLAPLPGLNDGGLTYPNSPLPARKYRPDRDELASPSALLIRANDSSTKRLFGAESRLAATGLADPEDRDGYRYNPEQSPTRAEGNGGYNKRSLERGSDDGSGSENNQDGYVWVSRKRSKEVENEQQ